MGLFSKKEGVDESKGSNLDAPISLPDSLIEKYGLDRDVSSKTDSDKTKVESSDGADVSRSGVDSRRFPEDLSDAKVFLDKFYDDSSKIEFLRDNENVASHNVNEQVNGINQADINEQVDNKQINNASNNNDLVNKNNINESRDSSFFSNLKQKIIDEDNKFGDTSSFNLVEMMKNFHSARSRGEHFFFHEQDLEDALYKKMLELKELEDEWLIRAKEFNIAKELLSDKEREIELVSQSLKSLLKKAEKFKLFNSKVSHDDAFRLSDGKILLCINDLLRELHIMGVDVFNHHVSGEKNDFANWVFHIFHDENLSNLIKKCTDRESLIKVLSDY